MGFFDILAAPFTAPTQGAMNILGGVTGQSAAEANQATQQSANSAFQMSQASADKQMAFQERMSNSSYQRVMKDMEAAGLNPMLAFSQGGASVPSGASATAQGVQYEDKGAAALSNIGRLGAAAKDISQLAPALSQMKAQTRTANATASQAEAMTPVTVAKQRAETNLTNATAQKVRAETTNAYATNKKIAQEIMNLEKEGKIKELSREDQERIQDWKRKNPYLFRTKQTLDSVNPLSRIIP